MSNQTLFTALHGMQTRSYDEISVRLSVCPSVCGGGRPLLPEILSESDRVGAKSPIVDLFSLVTLQP